MAIVNKIPQLRQALTTMSSERAAGRVLRQMASPAGQKLVRAIRKRAPVGSVEPDLDIERADGSSFTISRGRPSLRLHGVTLDSQWGVPEIDPIERGISLSIGSTAPHIGYVIDATTAKTRGPNAFHWGSPLRWSPKDGKGPGPRMFSSVDHPGTAEDNFVDLAIDTEGKVILLEMFSRTVTIITAPLRAFFG